MVPGKIKIVNLAAPIALQNSGSTIVFVPVVMVIEYQRKSLWAGAFVIGPDGKYPRPTRALMLCVATVLSWALLGVINHVFGII